MRAGRADFARPQGRGENRRAVGRRTAGFVLMKNITDHVAAPSSALEILQPGADRPGWVAQVALPCWSLMIPVCQVGAPGVSARGDDRHRVTPSLSRSCEGTALMALTTVRKSMRMVTVLAVSQLVASPTWFLIWMQQATDHLWPAAVVARRCRRDADDDRHHGF